jgi:tRNA pseudouridine38-40 synthase
MDPFFLKKHFYLIRIQFIGFRYHGWQKQLKVKTVQGMVNKTIAYVLTHKEFKTLGSGRTDAMVSANDFAFELFCYQELNDQFLSDFNQNLPPDIKALSIEKVTADFNIIQNAKVKEYHYLFSYGEKGHPFSAPFITHIKENLDIETMKKGAKLFEGVHNFYAYCKEPGENTQLVREILGSEVMINNQLKANFFPAISYLYKVKSSGFLYHQVRLMIGALIELGKGNISIEDLEQSLSGSGSLPIEKYLAPASGLILHQVDYQ